MLLLLKNMTCKHNCLYPTEWSLWTALTVSIIYKNEKNGMDNIGFLGYLSYLKMILTIEESICLTRHEEKTFNFLKPILDNL